jgi:hypothetical protein
MLGILPGCAPTLGGLGGTKTYSANTLKPFHIPQKGFQRPSNFANTTATAQ